MKRIIFPSAIFFLLLLGISCKTATKKEPIAIADSSFVLPDVRPFAQAHASTLTYLNNGDYLIAWFGGTKEKDDDVGIWLTQGNSKHWSAPIEIAKIREEPHWNPVLFRDEQDSIYLFFKVGKEIATWETWYIKSGDEGKSWSQATELVAADRGGRGPVRNKPIVLSNGDWIAGASNEQGVWRPFVDISKDGGKTWNRSAYFEFNVERLGGEGMIQPTLWESGDGQVHMLLRTSGGFIYRADSKDYGQTWNKPYATSLPNPNSGIDLVKLDNGDLLLLYNPDQKNWGSRGDLHLAISKDNGTSWDDALILEHGDKEDEYSYPAIIQSDGVVALTYTWNRSNIAFKRLILSKEDLK
ncbi:sialidase family protein [Sphingobacterium sp. HJSM2_6]|uniref:sialidase family protein n=1 Tax=Sphingobacterium sp. HJSM2_6 TaxID=3366264 RepID=UPI003BEEAACD